MKINNLIAKVVEIRNNSIEDGKINKNKIYGLLSTLNLNDYGVIEKKQGFSYISWTVAEMVMKLIDPESNIEYLEPIRQEMIRFKIRFLGTEYVSEYPILDNANQGAVLETTFTPIQVTKSVIEQTVNGEGVLVEQKTIQTSETQLVEKQELVFWQSGTKSKEEGRKARVTAMNINNSHQRGLAKEVSRITGFGISIYTGEDLKQYG